MALIGLDITSRTSLADGQPFGDTGPYEQLDGVARFAVDPANPLNACITDIALAPRDSDGRVRFEADLRILAPVDLSRGNRRLLFDVPNRGNRIGLRHFNGGPAGRAPSAPLDPGDGFLMNRGYAVAWLGWQHDPPPTPGLMRVHVPKAANDGVPVRGKVMVRRLPAAPAKALQLADRDHIPYPAHDLDETGATLTVRDFQEDEPRTIARDRWSFAREESGKPVADRTSIYLADGFEAGKFYTVVYTTDYAPVIGLGYLGPRDLVHFLRTAGAAEGNPLAGSIDGAYAFGASQSGRFLREFLYLGLNEAEDGSPVFDGVIAHIAGGNRGTDFNMRFGQPSNTYPPRFGNGLPQSLARQLDPVLGLEDGILERLKSRGRAPKVLISNSSTEYFRGDATMAHAAVDGSRDLPDDPGTRIYHFAGTQHGAGALPLSDTNLTGARGCNFLNTVDYRPLLKAMLASLDLWVTSSVEPPASRHPRLDDGTAVPVDVTERKLSAIPAIRLRDHHIVVRRNDWGPQTDEGIATILPPRPGEPFPHLVADVDADGNERDGLALPDVTVPLATYLGWNLRHPATGSEGEILELTGSTIPFARTRAEREAAGDPRPSIEERYASRDDYLSRVRDAAEALAAERLILEEDIGLVIQNAAERWDAIMALPAPAPADKEAEPVALRLSTPPRGRA